MRLRPDVPVFLNDLGYALTRGERFAEAGSLLRRALALRIKTLGPDHPDNAISLNNLAGIYYVGVSTHRPGPCSSGRGLRTGANKEQAVSSSSPRGPPLPVRPCPGCEHGLTREAVGHTRKGTHSQEDNDESQ